MDFLSNIFLITLDSNAMSQFKYILVSFIIKKLQQCPGNSVTNILIYLLTYRWWIHIMHTNSSSLLINFNCIEMFPASICVWPHSYKKDRIDQIDHNIFLNLNFIQIRISCVVLNPKSIICVNYWYWFDGKSQLSTHIYFRFSI